MDKWTTCLFGGALLSAGLTTQDAAAQSFTNEGSVGSAYAYDYANYDFASDSTLGFVNDPVASGSIIFGSTTASWSWDAPAGSWAVDFDQGSTAISAYASIASFFSISAAYDIEITWDITNIGFIGGWQVFESDDLIFTTDERIDGVGVGVSFGTPSEPIGLAGTATVSLVPGKFYQLGLDLFGNDGAPSVGTGSITAQLIPAPGAAATLAFAGLAATRRRR